MALIIPSIHSNGTGPKALVEQRCEIAHAARALQEALQAGAPHGRDFYTQPDPEAFKKANAIHVERLRMVEALIKDVTEEAIDIQKRMR